MASDLERKIKLTREQRQRIIAGDRNPLVYEDEPELEPGDRYVLNWSREMRSVVKDGDTVVGVATAPAVPLRWLTVTRITRRERGWSVSFEITDNRQRGRLPRRVPPAHVPTPDEGPLDAEAIARASEESNYTSDPRAAADDADGPEAEVLDRFAKENRERFESERPELIRLQQKQAQRTQFKNLQNRAERRGLTHVSVAISHFLAELEAGLDEEAA